ncbi:MAG: helix-turn-helix domain-containing protein [Sphingobacteriales bacterium]|nr:helix-turn-helix domain-containing protein [Sphingobacteriales bacterium]
MPYQLYHEKYDMESLSDFELLYRLKIVETLSANVILPSKIELFYNKDNSKKRVDFFSDLCKCEVTYTKQHNILYYNAEDLNQDIHYENYTLYTNLKPVLGKNINSLYYGKTYKNMIRSILLNNIEHFPVPIDFIARKLHISVRKLQLILKNENTRYSTIANEVIIIMGIEYLNRGKKIKEISSRLGYKEQGSFTRIFKQVTNINPVEYLQLTPAEKNKLINDLSN